MADIFAEEYTKIEKSLYLVAIGYLHNPEDAGDALQEAAVSGYQSFYKLKNRDFFKTWMTRIVINKCKDFLRKQKYTAELTDNLGVFQEIPTSQMEMLDAICRLDKESGLCIALRFYNDMTYEEMAKALRRPVSTVKYKTNKAMKQLKTLLEEAE